MECVSCLQRTANTVKKIPSDILNGDMTQTKQCISCNREVSSSDFFTTQFILPALPYLTSISPTSHHITLKFPSPHLTSLHVTYLIRVTYAYLTSPLPTSLYLKARSFTHHTLPHFLLSNLTLLSPNSLYLTSRYVYPPHVTFIHLTLPHLTLVSPITHLPHFSLANLMLLSPTSFYQT